MEQRDGKWKEYFPMALFGKDRLATLDPCSHQPLLEDPAGLRD